jgi:nucleoside triphosphate diphosphatase
LEEPYELFDAVRGGNAEELREELGDVLLQVLFHARIAEDATQHSFSIDDVADSLLRKLANRVPAVLAGEPISLADQLAQWEERKAAEKSRNSSMDDVPTGQPALALAQKVIDRVSASGLPADLLPASITGVALTVEGDAENDLRTSVLEFMDTVRTVERAIAADRRGEDVPEELDIASLGVITEEEWRAFWPSAAAVEVVEDEPIEEDVEPVEDEPVEEDVEPVEDEPVEEVDETPVDGEPVEEPEPEAAESK